jgi:hypothetical protein
MLVAYCLLFLPAIESNDTECTEEGEVYKYQEEEDQGQANQGKPSILDAYLILFTYFACFLKVYQNACFYIAIVLVAIICWLSSTSQIVIILRDDTSEHLFNTPVVVA